GRLGAEILDQLAGDEVVADRRAAGREDRLLHRADLGRTRAVLTIRPQEGGRAVLAEAEARRDQRAERVTRLVILAGARDELHLRRVRRCGRALLLLLPAGFAGCRRLALRGHRVDLGPEAGALG